MLIILNVQLNFIYLIISDFQNNALNIVLKARQQTFYVVQHEGNWGTELAWDSQNSRLNVALQFLNVQIKYFQLWFWEHWKKLSAFPRIKIYVPFSVYSD